MKVGIGIVTYNRVDYLKSCIESLFKTTHDGKLFSNLVIISDADDATSEFLRNNERVCIIKNAKRQGYVRSFNATLEKLIDLDSDIMFSVTDDVIFKESGWIQFYVDAIQKTGINYFVCMDGRNIVRRQVINGVEISYHSWVHAPMVIITKKCFQEIGGYDPQFEVGCMDTEYADRSNLKGLNGQVLYELTKNMLYFEDYKWFNMGFCADVENSRKYIFDRNHYIGEEDNRSYFPNERKGKAIELLQKKRVELGLLPNELAKIIWNF